MITGINSPVRSSFIDDPRSTPLLTKKEQSDFWKKYHSSLSISSTQEKVIVISQPATADSIQRLEAAHTSDEDLARLTKPRDRTRASLKKISEEIIPLISTEPLSRDEKEVVVYKSQKMPPAPSPRLEKALVPDQNGDQRKTETSSRKHRVIKIDKRHRHSAPGKVPSSIPRRITPPPMEAQKVLIEFVAQKIFFSQQTVSDTTTLGSTRNGDPLENLAERMFKNGFDKTYAIDIVEMQDNIFTSLDNRRLLIAKKIKKFCSTYPIWVKIHKFTEPLTREESYRFQAQTWGEAAMKRTNNEGWFKRYPRIVINGGLSHGEIKQNQQISFFMSRTEIESLILLGYDHLAILEKINSVSNKFIL